MTLGHLECASIASSHMLPRNGPAKSTCTRSHGLSGIGHGDKLAAGAVTSGCVPVCLGVEASVTAVVT